MALFDAAEGQDTFPIDINDGGIVVGRSEWAGRYENGFLRKPNGTIRIITSPNAPATAAVGINNHDEFVGFYEQYNLQSRSVRVRFWKPAGESPNLERAQRR